MEEWKPIVGYEELYEVSDMGRVRSKSRKTRIKDKESFIMQQKLDTHGYLRVNLTKDGEQKSLLVSRLVAEAFVRNPDPDRYKLVGHDNDIKTQNTSCNLYWTDKRENNFHNGKMESFQEIHKKKIGQIAEWLSKPVIGTNVKDGTEIRYKSMSEARKDGFAPEKISMCCNGKRKIHKGYYWRKAI